MIGVDKLFRVALRKKNLTLMGVLVSFTIASCGGGSNAPTANSGVAPNLVVTPTELKVYPGVVSTLEVISGVRPFRVSSTDQSLLSTPATIEGTTLTILANTVDSAKNAKIFIIDGQARQVEIAITVVPAPLITNVNVSPPTGSKCGQQSGQSAVSILCSGEIGIVQAQLKSTGAGGVANRTVRLDAIEGAFSFVASGVETSSTTAVSDQNGGISVRVTAPALIATQIAILRITDLTSGSRLDAAFNIVRSVGSAPVLSVLPTDTTTTGYFKNECLAATYDLVLFGGLPPYQVTSTLPNIFKLNTPDDRTPRQSVTVPSAGGTARVNIGGFQCSGPTTAIFYIADATGASISAKATSAPGSVEVVVTPPPAVQKLALSPPTQTIDCRNGLPRSILFTASGGKAPYVTSTSLPTVTTVTGTLLTIEPPGLAAGTQFTVTLVDATGSAVSSAITCQ